MNYDASQGVEVQKKIDELLKDPLARTMLLQRLYTQPMLQSSAVPNGTAPTPYLTPSGTAAGSGWPVFPVPLSLCQLLASCRFGVSTLRGPS